MVSVINPEMVSTDKWGNIVAVVSLVYVLSSTLGPVLGGLISERSTWRWIFLLKFVFPYALQ
jgi:MFS family permease